MQRWLAAASSAALASVSTVAQAQVCTLPPGSCPSQPIVVGFCQPPSTKNTQGITGAYASDGGTIPIAGNLLGWCVNVDTACGGCLSSVPMTFQIWRDAGTGLSCVGSDPQTAVGGQNCWTLASAIPVQAGDRLGAEYPASTGLQASGACDFHYATTTTPQCPTSLLMGGTACTGPQIWAQLCPAVDAGILDGGPSDGGSSDAGTPDAGTPDGGDGGPSDGGDGGPSDGGNASDGGSDGGVNGSVCGGSADCVSGNCVNNVCCSTACGPCGDCSTGSCTALPPGTSSTCGSYLCDGTNVACPTSCTLDTDCVAGDYCNPVTATCDPKLGGGAPCSGKNACVTGACLGNCCNTSCPTGGVCGATGCDSTGACLYPSGSCSPPTCTGGVATSGGICKNGSCFSSTVDCGAYACGATSCLASCVNDLDCAAGNVCNTSNGTCGPPVDAGSVDGGADAGALDSGSADAGPPDAGANDAGGPDAGDGGAVDGGNGDAGGFDAGPADSGSAISDAGSADAGPLGNPLVDLGCGCGGASGPPVGLALLALCLLAGLPSKRQSE